MHIFEISLYISLFVGLTLFAVDARWRYLQIFGIDMMFEEWDHKPYREVFLPAWLRLVIGGATLAAASVIALSQLEFPR